MNPRGAGLFRRVREGAVTNPGPIGLYPHRALRLHGRTHLLTYESPIPGPVEIFNHNPH
ncbi:MAG: hypothetical protein BWX84_00248 [Verrucomicrobia bacterium ADurb.Bin118]|jgi:hypothetical protein|nr:MAG: hypothetical protein BWX84_00248 [Verrucomicrobia bacterium ADurb.Bin118]